MSMKPSPAFQLYPQDFLVGTAELTAEQVGAYIRLLCYQWSKGSLPDDDRALCGLAVTRRSTIDAIRSKFVKQDDGTLINTRLEEVRTKQDAYRQKQVDRASRSSRGTAAAEPRQSRGTAVAVRNTMPDASRIEAGCEPDRCSSSSSSSSDTDNTNTGASAPAVLNLDNTEEPPTPKRFAPPTPEEVTAYSAEISYPLDGAAWCDSYAQKGWMVGKSKMKDWRAAVRNWKSNGWKPNGGRPKGEFDNAW